MYIAYVTALFYICIAILFQMGYTCFVSGKSQHFVSQRDEGDFVYCRKCGAKLEPNEKFCPFCGQPMEDSEQSNQASSINQDRNSGKQPQHSESAPAPAKKSLNMGLIAGIAVAAVVVLAVILVLVFRPGGNDSPGGTVESPGITASDAPSLEPTQEPTEPSESVTEPPTGDFSGLYIGTWAAEGCTVGDEENGWQALYLSDVGENTLTFYLESTQAAPSSRTASTYPITVTMDGDKASFAVNDSWGNSGTGELIISDGVIHVTVDITAPDPNSMWDVSMDADFFPDTFEVATDNGPVALSKPLYYGGATLFALDDSLKALGINVFYDDGMGATVAMTKSHALYLISLDGYSTDIFVDGQYIDTSGERIDPDVNGQYYWCDYNGTSFAIVDTGNGVYIDTLSLFGLEIDLEWESQTWAISGTIDEADRVSDELAESLLGFTFDVASKRVQDAGYTFATAGGSGAYWGGSKVWYIPVETAQGIDFVSVLYDGEFYSMNGVS